ncbi:molybdopterin-guanine dinucleotide biosynthesis protein B [Paenibacillus sediminis]|uniref:Molybdopterin-guanine dinucleotide biosynthesis protein B n=1 Tax=Paenibacillus sediminis TaxID=664909 RepID=A0ABS4H504_9BACL|nr:molybdopterin-guanine dinucleotide biosynthesis protein B [Paenibacillus sediminis]MBP1937556.1 molybdopterin-guanine dinucleotide biosynthesis protein B [Paenibacillus sediminis]
MKVIQFVGYKNTGKTTLVCRLVNMLNHSGYKVGAIKHDAHHFEMDHPGKDTWNFREAGAQAVAITSKTQSAYLEETQVPLAELISRMEHMDYILVEGFKKESYPKIVIVKCADQAALVEQSEKVRAVVSWGEISEMPYSLPQFHIDETDKMFHWIINENWES